MANGDSVQVSVSMKIGPKSSLHGGLQALDRQTVRDRDFIDDRLQGLPVIDRAKEGWAGRERELALTESDVNPPDIESIEVIADAFGYIARSGCGKRIGEYTDPHGRVADETNTVFNRHDAWHPVVIVYRLPLCLILVLVLFFVLFPILFLVTGAVDGLVWPLVEPGKPDEVHGRDDDIIFLEQSDNLVTKQCKSRVSERKGLRNMIPRQIPLYGTLADLSAESVIVLNGNDSHYTLVFLGPSWLVKLVGGVPPNELGAATTFGTMSAGVVEMLLGFGDGVIRVRP